METVAAAWEVDYQARLKGCKKYFKLQCMFFLITNNVIYIIISTQYSPKKHNLTFIKDKAVKDRRKYNINLE